MKPILEVEKISKEYKVGQHRGYLSLREKMTGAFRMRRADKEIFWALNDISFTVQPGESVGIIGRNGAGKSTLLKILSKITPPTKGRVVARGRVASLLEVGTGFHPELTGRENIFFNGSLLGMKRQEILSSFDEIVDFSGTGKFLDTSLKHYSSGMQLRLAFSVAAFLEPEILIIDEVLAVGDAEFQKKCLRKMEDVSKGGRTILFVSHSMAAVQSLCTRGIVLNGGKSYYQGTARDSIQEYIRLLENATPSGTNVIIPKGNIIQRVELYCDGAPLSAAYMGCELEIRVYFKSERPLDFPVLGVIFYDFQGEPLLAINNKHYVGNVTTNLLSDGYISMKIPYITLFAGNYQVDIHFGNAFVDLEVLRNCFQLTIERSSFSPTGEIPDEKFNRFFIRDIRWEVKENSR
jgi:lipopolysaccharide transport system ATP-binding protein